jgi:hypothetical protein
MDDNLGAPFLTVPASSMTGVPLSPGALFSTLVAFYRYIEGAGWVFDGWDYPSAGDYPSGYEYQQVGALPSAYIVVVARSDPQLGMCPVPIPGQLPEYWQVDMPTTPGSAPAPVNSTLVGTWGQSVDSTTGWAFESWSQNTWDYAPDGHQFNQDPNGQQTLDLVFARTDPLGTVIGIPYNHQQGSLPIPAPTQTSVTGSHGTITIGEQDEVGACCTNIVTGLQALTTSVQAIAALVGAHTETVVKQQPANCCENIVAAISQVADGITKVVSELPNLAGKDVSLTGVVEALREMRAALASAIADMAAGAQSDTNALAEAIRGSQADASAQLKRIADAMPSSPPAPVQPDPWIQQFVNLLVDQGALDPETAQLLTGG